MISCNINYHLNNYETIICHDIFKLLAINKTLRFIKIIFFVHSGLTKINLKSLNFVSEYLGCLNISLTTLCFTRDDVTRAVGSCTVAKASDSRLREPEFAFCATLGRLHQFIHLYE